MNGIVVDQVACRLPCIPEYMAFGWRIGAQEWSNPLGLNLGDLHAYKPVAFNLIKAAGQRRLNKSPASFIFQ